MATATTPVSNDKLTTSKATSTTVTTTTAAAQLPASSNSAAEVKVYMLLWYCIYNAVFLLASLHQCQPLHQPRPLSQHKRLSQPLQQRLVNKSHQSQQLLRYCM